MTVAAISRVLGGKKVLKREIETTSELVSLTREGLPADILPALANELAMDRKVVARALGIPERTLSRRLDRIVRLARVLALAADTFGDTAKASRWLQTPNRVLQGQTPFELLDTDTGVQSVETVLGRIAYGVYS
jgi:putative toxin-antitoxin system antitoxin component (TIGR02293 family)